MVEKFKPLPVNDMRGYISSLRGATDAGRTWCAEVINRTKISTVNVNPLCIKLDVSQCSDEVGEKVVERLFRPGLWRR
jgi:hypothetical protein